MSALNDPSIRATAHISLCWPMKTVFVHPLQMTEYYREEYPCPNVKDVFTVPAVVNEYCCARSNAEKASLKESTLKLIAKPNQGLA